MSRYSELRESIEAVDGVTTALAKSLVADLKSEFGPDVVWLEKDIDKVQAVVDRNISSTYGSTRGNARRSRLYQVIYGRVKFTSDREVDRYFSDLNAAMNRWDRKRWSAVRSAAEARGDDFGGALMSLKGPIPAKERRRRSRLMDPDRRWVRADGYRLSDRVWRSGNKQRKQIDNIIRTGIRRGDGVNVISRRLNRYLLPSNSPVIYKRDGRVVRRKLNTGGGGANSARSLVRTELQAVAHQATKVNTKILADKMPGVGMRWSLSPSHPKIDICDFYARNSSQGFPPGVYRVEDFPSVPHPKCLCGAQPYTPSREEVMDYLEREYLGR